LEEVAAGLLDGSISTGYGVVAEEEPAEEEAATEEPAEEATEEPAVEAAPQNLLAVAAADGRFTTLGLAVDMGGLTEALNGEGPFTIFSPTDEAFGQVPADVVGGLMADPAVLVATLKYHVVPGKLMAADLAGVETLTTLEGTEITVETDADGNVILNGTVKVIAADIEADNGVLHAIDGVLLLPAAEAPAVEATPAPEATEEATTTIGAGADLGVIKVGMNAEYQPFEFVDEAGNIAGFDPDLVALVAERAGFDYELVNTRWDGIFVALASGEFDMVASAATITAEREEIVDFTNPYFYANQRIAVLESRAGEIQDVDDLAGLRVAVQAGTTGDIFASEIPGVEMLRYDEITLAFQALASGDADAIVNDGPVSADIIEKNPELGAVLVGPPLSEEYYGMAIQPDRPELLDAVNKALAEIIADGTYQELFEKWFGVKPPEMFLPQQETIGMGADLGVIKVGMNAEYQPFEFVDEAGNIAGFDPDLVALVAERAGFDYELVNTRWDGIFVALASGEFDMVASAATITAEREEIVDFTNPYFYANQRIAVLESRAGEIQDVDDLAGLRVAVQAGTTGDIFASEIPGVEMLRYDEITLAFQALASGDADAIVNDGPVSADIIEKNPELGAVLVGPPLSEEYYGMAIQPDRPELLDAVNKALAEIIADGTYQELFEKWFGVKPPEMFLPQE
ncbi:MAG: transporter substrate-binding domain-containing protein, partial [Anaerolineae bacterium]|nr:transporter substrate-binding domain-containing protein [Anaerolineae bacterium]